jgi:hypothetical protein
MVISIHLFGRELQGIDKLRYSFIKNQRNTSECNNNQKDYGVDAEAWQNSSAKS